MTGVEAEPDTGEVSTDDEGVSALYAGTTGFELAPYEGIVSVVLASMVAL